MMLRQWTARRAGGRVTVTGTASDGSAAKIVGVDTIEPKEGRCIATDKDGQRHELIV